MDFVPSFLKPVDVSRAEFHKAEQTTKLSDESAIGALFSFFTENINSLITASLIYFTLFAGFTRMKNKHIAALVPCAAAWTVYQASSLLIPLGGAAAVMTLAKAYFAWQSTSDADVVREGTNALKEQAKDLSKSLVEQAMNKANLSEKNGATPFHREAMQTVSKQLQKPAATPILQENADFDQILRDYEEAEYNLQKPAATPILQENTDFDQILRDYEEAEYKLQMPSNNSTYEPAWNEATTTHSSDAWASEFFSQHQEAREVVTSLSKEQLNVFNEAWGSVQKQKPGAKMNDPWVQQFMSEQCKQKGLPWGKIAKFAGLAVMSTAAGYGIYKLYEYATTPEQEEKEEKTTGVKKAEKQNSEQLKKKQKQVLAMHLLFGKSRESQVFQAKLKRRTKASPTAKETAGKTPSLEGRVIAEGPNKKNQAALNRLAVLQRHSSRCGAP